MNENPLKEHMTADELFALPKTQSLHLAVMQINGWYVKGQYCTLIAHAMGRQFPFARYRCIESGKGESRWQFDCEIHYSL